MPNGSQFIVHLSIKCKILYLDIHTQIHGLPGGSVVKNLPPNAGDIRDPGSVPGSGRSPGRGLANSFQYSCLENPMDRGSWQATVHGVAKSQTWLKQLITRAHTYTYKYSVYICITERDHVNLLRPYHVPGVSMCSACMLLHWVFTTTSLPDKHGCPCTAWRQTQRGYVNIPKVTQLPVAEPGLKSELSSFNNRHVFPLRHTGYLRNKWCCHPFSQCQEWIQEWLKKYIPGVFVWNKYLQRCAHIHRVKTQSPASPNQRMQLLRMSASAKGPQLEAHRISPTGPSLPLGDLHTCYKIDGEAWNKVTVLLDLNINNSDLSILFRNIKVKYFLMIRSLIIWNMDIWWY